MAYFGDIKCSAKTAEYANKITKINNPTRASSNSYYLTLTLLLLLLIAATSKATNIPFGGFLDVSSHDLLWVYFILCSAAVSVQFHYMHGLLHNKTLLEQHLFTHFSEQKNKTKALILQVIVILSLSILGFHLLTCIAGLVYAMHWILVFLGRSMARERLRQLDKKFQSK